MKNGTKKCGLRVLAVMLAFALLIGLMPEASGMAAAKKTLKDRKAVVKALNEAGMAQKKKLMFQYKGKDLKTIWKEKNTLLRYDLVKLDEDDTSSDADYLAANIVVDPKKTFSQKGNTITCNLQYYEKKSQTKKVDAKVKKLLQSEGWEELGAYEKAKQVHDWIILQTTRDTGKKQQATASSAYGVLVQGKANSNGYAMAYYKLLTELDVPCKIVFGTAGTGKKKAAHTWNLVKLGDKWYHVDCAMDDPDTKDQVKVDYFLTGSSQIRKDHVCDAGQVTSRFEKEYPVSKTAYKPGNESTSDKDADDDEDWEDDEDWD